MKTASRSTRQHCHLRHSIRRSCARRLLLEALEERTVLAAITYAFDSSEQGWRLGASSGSGVGGNAIYSSGEGNPGGFNSASFSPNDALVTPVDIGPPATEFGGRNLSSYYGGLLSFDAKMIDVSGTPAGIDDIRVQFDWAAGVGKYWHVWQSSGLNQNSWTHYSVPILVDQFIGSATGIFTWQRDILGHIASVRIFGGLDGVTSQKLAIDNFRIEEGTRHDAPGAGNPAGTSGVTTGSGSSTSNPILPIGPRPTPPRVNLPPNHVQLPNEWVFDPPPISGGLWHDPDPADAFLFETSNDSFFTHAAFPTGFVSPFEVWVGTSSLGHFGPGSDVDFTTFAVTAKLFTPLRALILPRTVRILWHFLSGLSSTQTPNSR